MKQKLAIVLAAMAFSVGGLTVTASAEPRPSVDKVTICHRDNGKPGYKAITINSNALAVHLAHGDLYPVPPGGCPTGGNYPPKRPTVAPSSRSEVAAIVASLASGASVAAAFEAVSSDSATRDRAAGDGAALPRTGANSISHLQLGSVAVIGGVGMLLIARLRRRALRPATITS